MPECQNLAGCSFFNDRMANMPVTAEMIKRKICKGDNTVCARYMVSKAVGKEHVPANLIPNQLERVEEIIAAVKEAENS
ncbi:MAG: hypothetical protein GXY86_07735 [Firmicutes bacterium]|nr:hypothetical protein [Bacillota bacterium]